MATTKLIPGFRFHPTDVELLRYFLRRKVIGKKFPFDVIAEVEINKYAPWDLPDKSRLRTGDLEWYFFCPREKKYAIGARMNRTTEVGYWKTTGRDRPVHYKNRVVGMIKTLIFHTGRAPKGNRTDWVMHEFRLEDQDLTDKGIPQDFYVLCKVFQKDGPGPRNGAQYGRPFNDEDWDNDEDIDGAVSLPLVGVHDPSTIHPDKPGSSKATHGHPPASTCIGSPPLSCLMHPSAPSDQVTSNSGSQVPVNDDDITALLDYFTEKDTGSMTENNIEKNDNDNSAAVEKEAEPEAAPEPCLDVNDIFKDLGDLDNTNQTYPAAGNMPPLGLDDDSDFLELLDLEPFVPLD